MTGSRTRRMQHTLILLVSVSLFAIVTIAMALVVLLPRWDVITMRGETKDGLTPSEVEGLRARADLIIMGDVSRVGSPERRELDAAARARMRRDGMSTEAIAAWVRREGDELHTVCRLRSPLVLKGRLNADAIDVRVPAGSQSGRRHGDDDVYLVKGERAVLFLDMAADGEPEPLGIYVVNDDYAVLRGPGPANRIPLRELLQAIDRGAE